MSLSHWKVKDRHEVTKTKNRGVTATLAFMLLTCRVNTCKPLPLMQRCFNYPEAHNTAML